MKLSSSEELGESSSARRWELIGFLVILRVNFKIVLLYDSKYFTQLWKTLMRGERLLQLLRLPKRNYRILTIERVTRARNFVFPRHVTG